jgi:GxxExxY protein
VVPDLGDSGSCTTSSKSSSDKEKTGSGTRGCGAVESSRRRNFSSRSDDKAGMSPRTVKPSAATSPAMHALSSDLDEKQASGNFLDDPLTGLIIGACMEVHGLLGPGLLESVYEECLCRELTLRGLSFERQQPVPIRYKGLELPCGYRTDVIVDQRVLVELKTVDGIQPVHLAQVLTNMKLLSLDVGLLINFNVASLRQGIRRLTPKPLRNSPSPRLPVSFQNAPHQGEG